MLSFWHARSVPPPETAITLTAMSTPFDIKKPVLGHSAPASEHYAGQLRPFATPDGHLQAFAALAGVSLSAVPRTY
jgi:hypothetical protein